MFHFLQNLDHKALRKMKKTLYYLTLIAFVICFAMISICLIIDEDVPINYTNLTYQTVILGLFQYILKDDK